MMRWIVGSSLTARRAVVAAAVVIMVFGVWTLRHAEVDALPEFAPVTVQVQTEALGLSAEEVEQLITVPMEQDLLDGAAWLDSIHSRSVPGLSSITMLFEPGTDLYRARQVVQERISQAAGLPQVSKPPQMLQPTSSTARTAMISLSSTSIDPLEIGVLARWTIRPRLLAVPGVANVAIWGQRERQLQVQVDPAKLRDKNVTLEQIISSTGNALWVSPLTFLEASSPGTGGFIDTPSQRLGIQHNLPIIAPADLAQVPIEEATGAAQLTLGDVATVVEDHQPLIGDAVLTGEAVGDAGFMVVVDKLPYANTADVTKGIEDALDELRPGLAGLEMDSTIFRPASYVDQSVDNLQRSVLIGAVLLIAVLFALFLSWRAAVTAAVAIALSFTVAALVIHLLGKTFNVVVLAGLVVALAAVVDDAIVNIDRCSCRLRERGEPDETAAAASRVVLGAVVETGRTAVWATVIFALALTPLLFMDGVSGDSFYPPMAAASLLAVVASLAVAVTVTPALGVLLVSKARRPKESPVVAWLQRGFDRMAPAVRTPIPAIDRHRRRAARGRPSWSPDPTRCSCRTCRTPTSSSTGTHRSGPRSRRWTASRREPQRSCAPSPGVRDVGAQVGQATLGDSPVGSDSAEMWVSIDKSADYGSTVAAVRAVVAGYPGLRHEVTTYSKDKMIEALGQTSDEITVRLFGADLDLLHQNASDLAGDLASIDGIAERDRRQPTDGADDGSGGRPGPRHGEGAEARRRPSGRSHVAVRTAGRQPLRGPEGLRCGGLEHTRVTRQPVERRGPPHRRSGRSTRAPR